MTDNRSNRSLSKKYPLLNSYLFTKKDPEGELQGQTILGKFSTHEYHCTNKSYENDEKTSGARKLRNKMLGFFDHYRSNEAIGKYEVLACRALREEFKQLEDHVQLYWSIGICKNFFASMRTNKVESFFATRLGFVPKHINMKSPFMYRAKMNLCSMRWNEKHISGF